MSDIQQTIADQVKSNRVVLYMKGTADFPMCGFSARATKVLQATGVPFKDFNILEDDELRQGLKVYSEWPTFPQVYVDGEFLGGSDILMEMYESGELQKVLSSAGQPS